MWLALAPSVTPVVLRSSSRPGAELGLHLRAEVVERAGQAGDERSLGVDAGIDRPSPAGYRPSR